MTRPHKYGAKPGWYTKDLQPCLVQCTCSWMGLLVPHCPACGEDLSSDDACYYFQSQLELRRAERLKMMEAAGKIKFWIHHPAFWDFALKTGEPFRRNSRYRPDFYVCNNDNSVYYIECKGHNYSGSLTKLRRAIKLYPEKTLYVETSREMVLAADYLSRFDATNKMKRKMRKLVK